MLISEPHMINRRQFLVQAPAVCALAQTARGKIRQVDIIHHTHTDIGYTELPSVVRDLQKRYLDVAVDACRHDRTFRWTVESLIGLDDWWRDASESRRNELLQLVESGQMDVMGMPFNQTPFLNAAEWKQMMAWIPARLRRTRNVRAAMQNDVNGMPRAGAMGLLDHGVKHLLMGINADSGGPPFRRPSAFWWNLPDGRRMFVWLGEHYGSSMNYLQPAMDGNHLLLDEAKIRAAHAALSKRLNTVEAEGYAHDRLILTFTHPRHYDNGAPFPSLAPFIAKWNTLGLEPRLRLTTATEAVLDMERLAGASIPELSGEWTDWWANGDASGPREVAASRQAKRHLAAAGSRLFGPMPAGAPRVIESILKDLCLFDEHTWGAAGSISQPYSLDTQGQYVEKSELAYRPMGAAEALLSRRIRAILSNSPQGVYAINPWPAETSGWTRVNGIANPTRSVVDVKSGERLSVRKERGAAYVWVEKMSPHSMRAFREESAAGADASAVGGPEVRLNAAGWPETATWTGMRRPLFDGAQGEFILTAAVPPADRRTIAQLHANPDAEKRAAIRKTVLHETTGECGRATSEETPHSLVYTQDIQHPRISNARRRMELWKREPRARVTVRFDRLSANAPEVIHIGFTLPEGVPLPVFTCGGVPFTPYRDQLKGTCKDYFGIDGSAQYSTADGHWLWVTRDAPLVSVGGPHVVERHQAEPSDTRRILAMVFDNCWHTNFVADSHGAFEFQFDFAWAKQMARPMDLAEALAGDAIGLVNPATNQAAEEIENLYRK